MRTLVQRSLAQDKFRRKLVGFSILLVFIFFATVCFGAVRAVAKAQVEADSSHETEPAGSVDPGVVKSAFLAAAIAVGVGSLGGGAAVGYVGAAAMGAIGEKPELAGRALIFVGLAEGIAIYGLIIAIMILGKV